MRGVISAGLAIAALLPMSLAAGGANAQDNPLEKAFNHLCIDHHADTAAVMATADAEGWKPAPESTTGDPDFRKSVEMLTPENLQARTLVADGKALVVMAGQGTLPIAQDEKLKVNFCAVGVDAMPADAVKADMRGQLGFAPVQSDPDTDLYAFTETNGQRAPFQATDSDAAKKAGEAGHLSLIVVVGQGAQAALVYAEVTGATK